MIETLIFFYFSSYFASHVGDVKTYTRLMFLNLNNHKDAHIKRTKMFKGDHGEQITNVSTNKILKRYN